MIDQDRLSLDGVDQGTTKILEEGVVGVECRFAKRFRDADPNAVERTHRKHPVHVVMVKETVRVEPDVEYKLKGRLKIFDQIDDFHPVAKPFQLVC